MDVGIRFDGYVKVLLNGRGEYVFPDTSLAQLLRSHKYNLEWLVVEHNNRIVRPEHRDALELRDGDRIEVLTFSGEGI